MTSRKKTTLAILRTILGPVAGSETQFPFIVRLSPSWVKKASAGTIPMTLKAATEILRATGISHEWLMNGDVTAMPVERDGRTPYTIKSFERWQEDFAGMQQRRILDDPNAMAIATILRALHSAKKAGKATTASYQLWQFSEALKQKYGWSGADESLQFISETLAELITEITGKRPVIKTSMIRLPEPRITTPPVKKQNAASKPARRKSGKA